MTRQEAEHIYFQTHKTAEEMIRRYMAWNPKLSIPENARLLRVSPDGMRRVARKARLKHKIIGKGNNYGGICLKKLK